MSSQQPTGASLISEGRLSAPKSPATKPPASPDSKIRSTLTCCGVVGWVVALVVVVTQKKEGQIEASAAHSHHHRPRSLSSLRLPPPLSFPTARHHLHIDVSRISAFPTQEEQLDNHAVIIKPPRFSAVLLSPSQAGELALPSPSASPPRQRRRPFLCLALVVVVARLGGSS